MPDWTMNVQRAKEGGFDDRDVVLLVPVRVDCVGVYFNNQLILQPMNTMENPVA